MADSTQVTLTDVSLSTETNIFAGSVQQRIESITCGLIVDIVHPELNFLA